MSWKVWLCWFVAFSLVSAVLPRDASFDVAHYHLHNGWSFWNDRLFTDRAPADLHTYLNPLYSAFLWPLVNTLPGPAVMFLLSPVQAALLPVLWAFSARLLTRMDIQLPVLVLAIVVASGFLALPNTLMVSSLYNDHWGALAFIFALVLIIGRDELAPSARALAISAFAVGAMTGLKLTNAIYIPGLAAAVLIAVQGLQPRIRAVAICAAAGLAGILAFGGWWAMQMYSSFGNPVFPNLNGLFPGAELGPDEAFRDTRYLPDSFLHALMRPFQFSLDNSLIFEYDFKDPRFLLGYLAIIAGMVHFARRTLQKTLSERDRPAGLLTAMFLAVFITWSMTFSIMRYASALWVLAPTIALVIAGWVAPRLLQTKGGHYVAITSALLLVMATDYASLRRVPWSGPTEPYVSVRLPETLDVHDKIVVFSALYPTAFLAPAFSDAAMLTHGHSPPWSRPAMERYRKQTAELIARSDRDVLGVMFLGEYSTPKELGPLASEYGLTSRFELCRPIETSFDIKDEHWIVCPLLRPEGTERSG